MLSDRGGKYRPGCLGLASCARRDARCAVAQEVTGVFGPSYVWPTSKRSVKLVLALSPRPPNGRVGSAVRSFDRSICSFCVATAWE